jgi:hypothetical protein
MLRQVELLLALVGVMAVICGLLVLTSLLPEPWILGLVFAGTASLSFLILRFEGGKFGVVIVAGALLALVVYVPTFILSLDAMARPLGEPRESQMRIVLARLAEPFWVRRTLLLLTGIAAGLVTGGWLGKRQ